MKPTIGGPLDLAALAKLHPPTRPAAVCSNCWAAWRAAPLRPPFGYCWHAGIAWRVRASGRVRTLTLTRAEYRDLLASLEVKR